MKKSLPGQNITEEKMKIIIVGCGKVGATLAEQLSKEGNDITVIDRNYSVVQSLSNEFDIPLRLRWSLLPKAVWSF